MRYNAFTITRSPAQKPACKDLRRNGQDRAITPEAAYTPVSNRAGSRSHKKEEFPITDSFL
ncbi:alpha-galactosidase [Lacticaseibacillus casei]|nr:alpha-galactosidase [Lacticaseibacillus casei]